MTDRIDLSAVIGPIVLVRTDWSDRDRLAVLLAAFHLLLTYDRPDAYLALIGPCADRAVAVDLQRFSDQLNLTRTLLAPDAPAAAGEAVARRATVIVTDTDWGTRPAPLAGALDGLIADRWVGR
jgi:hypothetical protein